MILYVAGPMTGLPDFNYPMFNRVTEVLELHGYTVENPATSVNPTPEDYHGWLRAGLEKLIRAEGVALLPGWEASGGARLEVQVGATLGMMVKPWKDWLPEAIRDHASA